MSSTASPTVSVCLPVYNGQAYVVHTIRSILAQSFTDFELILADNASTDQTTEIFRETERQDRRVRYLGATENRGLVWNFNRAFHAATGRYVIWIGYDDIMEPTLLEHSIAALEADPQAVLVYSLTRFIDDDGQTSGMVESPPTGGDERPSMRLEQILFDAMCNPIVGMMRRESLAKTRLHLPYADSDRVLLAELGLLGRFHYLEQPLFARRLHRGQTTRLFDDRWARTLIFDPSQRGRVLCPWLREVRDLIRAVRRSPVRGRERLECYKRVHWWVSAHRRFITEDAWRGVRHWLPKRGDSRSVSVPRTISTGTH
ncbi:MAG: glycosyltransferase [Pirellulales bacterium]